MQLDCLSEKLKRKLLSSMNKKYIKENKPPTLANYKKNEIEFVRFKCVRNNKLSKEDIKTVSLHSKRNIIVIISG